MTTAIATTCRARSVAYENEPAMAYISWLNARWSELTEAQRKSATIECRPNDDFAMVGLRWEDNA